MHKHLFVSLMLFIAAPTFAENAILSALQNNAVIKKQAGEYTTEPFETPGSKSNTSVRGEIIYPIGTPPFRTVIAVPTRMENTKNRIGSNIASAALIAGIIRSGAAVVVYDSPEVSDVETVKQYVKTVNKIDPNKVSIIPVAVSD